MEEKNNQKKKEIAMNDLALIMAKEFEKSNRLTDKKIETLAVLVQNGFWGMEERLGGVEGRLGGVEGRLDRIEIDVKEIKSDTEDIKAELNKKVDKFTHSELEYRVEKLEKKFA